MKQKHLPFLFALLLFCALASAQTMVADSSFGTNGIAKIDPLGYDMVYTNSILVQNNKPLFAANGTFDIYGTEGKARRLTSSGLPDNTFADQGILDTRSSYSSFVTRLVLQPDNKLLTVTVESPHYDYPVDTVWLERFLPDGAVDSSFGTNGAVPVHKQYANMGARNLVLKPDGKMVLGVAADGVLSIVQFSPAGKTDTHFGVNGRIMSQSVFDGNISDLLALPDNKLLAADIYKKADNTYGSCLIRYTAGGKIDSAFGVNGILVNNNTITNTNRSLDLILQQDGKVLLYTEDSGNDILLRYKANATLDASFGTNGKAIIGATQAAPYAAGGMVDVQANRRIVISLLTPKKLKRFLPDGTLDASFGTDGTWDFSSVVSEGISFSSYRNGLIVAGGISITPGYKDIVVAVYKPCFACASADAISNTLPAQKMNPAVAKQSIRLYPNPVTRLLHVQYDGTAGFALLNPAGKVVLTTIISGAGKMDVSRLPAGVYYLRNNTTNTSEKVVIDK